MTQPQTQSGVTRHRTARLVCLCVIVCAAGVMLLTRGSAVYWHDYVYGRDFKMQWAAGAFQLEHSRLPPDTYREPGFYTRGTLTPYEWLPTYHSTPTSRTVSVPAWMVLILFGAVFAALRPGRAITKRPGRTQPSSTLSR